MIRVTIASIGKGKLLRGLAFPFCKDKIVKTPQEPHAQIQKLDGKEVLTEIPESELVDIKQNTTMVPGSEDREFVQLTGLQKQIVEKKEFDLLDKRISLQKMGISDIMSENLTKIDLGYVGIKSRNQILLKDVDPENIPEDMDIIFESKKKLTLVGKRIRKGESKGNLMKVDEAAFQQKSLSQFRGQAFGVGKIAMVFNKVQFLRFTFLLLPVFFLIQPFLTVQGQLDVVRGSITVIEEEQKQNIRKTKKYYYRKVLLKDPDFVQV